jgi:hypothetical protein
LPAVLCVHLTGVTKIFGDFAAAGDDAFDMAATGKVR